MINISIHSVPRSGSTWLGSIFDSSPNTSYRFQPLFSYTHKGYLTPYSDNQDIDSFFKSIYKTKDDFVLQKKAKIEGLVPEFAKEKITHIVYKEVRYHNILKNLLDESKQVKVIGLIRNPFSVLTSWLKAPKEFRKDLNWSITDEWKGAPSKNLNKPEEFYGYEKWKEVCFLFLNLKENYPDRFYLLNYEDLLKNKELITKQLFDFCSLKYTIQTNEFLNTSSSIQSEGTYSVYKRKTDDLEWKDVLPDFIKKTIKTDPDFVKLNKLFQWI